MRRVFFLQPLPKGLLMSLYKKKLPWPCSRVERDVLHSLWLKSRLTGKSISEIVNNAICDHLND